MMHEKDDVLRATRLKQLSTSAMIVVAVVIVVIIVGPGSLVLNRLTNTSTSANPEITAPDDALAPTTAANIAVVETPTIAAQVNIASENNPTGNQLSAASGSLAALIPVESLTAHGIYAYDVATGEMLYGVGENEELAIGSTTKIATALVVLDYVSPDDEIVIDQTDLVDTSLYSNMGLVAGDTLTVEQLLQGLLVASGTDAAQALARVVGTGISGSDDPETARAAFISAMNDYATQLGLTQTHFANPGGEDNPGNFSTAKEIALLGGELMQEPMLAEIVAMPSYSFVSSGTGQTYEGANTNQMLGTDGIVGVKTGSTDQAGGCVVLAQDGAGVGDLMIVAILGSDLTYNNLSQIVTDTRWADAQAIFAGIDSAK
jgi:serine-type D-Ala-D-Ala carboxypeptidase (penicillin-binding protein 5/6)